jgi:DNA-binding FadR family transcriptional regulator
MAEANSKRAGGATSRVEEHRTAGPDIGHTVRDEVFAPIGKGGLVEQTVRRLGEAIGLGLLEEGERLPPEAELAERLGIATMTLREALAILRESGFIETRRGRSGGTVVKRVTPFPPPAEARKHLSQLTRENLQDLTDFRTAVSGYAAGLAAERATKDDIAHLGELVGGMSQDIEFEVFRRLDTSFHVGIASAANSPHLLNAEASVQREMAPLLSVVGEAVPVKRAFHASNDQHRLILSAIADKDAAKARELMETHVAGTAEYLIGLRLGTLT